MQLQHPTLRKTPRLPMILTLACLSGCALRTKVVYIQNREPVRLAEDVKAHVWVPDASGKLVKSSNPITLQEGSYNVIDPKAPPTPAQETKK